MLIQSVGTHMQTWVGGAVCACLWRPNACNGILHEARALVRADRACGFLRLPHCVTSYDEWQIMSQNGHPVKHV